jgi:hypothetical protein
MRASKSAADFVVEDFFDSPVWRYKAAEHLEVGEDESWMLPTLEYPVSDMFGHVVGTQVQLADGSSTWVAIFNTWSTNPEMNEKSQSFMFLSDDDRCVWSPSGNHGNTGLVGAEVVAAFLNRSLESVFPFQYDISAFANGDASVLRRAVASDGSPKPDDPAEAAMQAALMALQDLRRD